MKLQINIGQHQEVIDAREDKSILSALRQAGHQVESPCGGKGTCGKCQVHIAGLGDVLSCQTKPDMKTRSKAGLALNDLMEVTLPLTMAAHISTDGLLPEVKLNPLIKRIQVHLPAPKLDDQRPFDQRFAAVSGYQVPLTLLRNLPDVWLEKEIDVACLVREDTKQVVSWPALTENAPALTKTAWLGIAVDIGTTTIGSWLYDLESGERLATAAMLNPQRNFGADVISRIDAASELANRQMMRTQVTDALDQLAEALIEKAFLADRKHTEQPGTKADQLSTEADLLSTEAGRLKNRLDSVTQVVIAGNTTMLHLLTGMSPAAIAKTPFIPVSLSAQFLTAEALNLKLPPQAVVQLLPGISSYVGADITAGLLACDMTRKEADIKILLDIGTNGEIVLAGPAGLIACSTAAGPAFEGANIACGLGGVSGAVDNVWWEKDQLRYTVINPQESVNGSHVLKPRGLCGSGLIAAVAACLEKGLIDETGRIEDDLDELPQTLHPYIGEFDGQTVIILVDAATGERGRPVYLSQKDIREVQNAKAAMAAGILLLIEMAGISPDQVSALYLAGGFGQHLQPEHAFTIGLLPVALRGRTQAVGNTSGMGAVLCLLDQNKGQLAAETARLVRYYELSADKRFTDLYIEAMMFPED